MYVIQLAEKNVGQAHVTRQGLFYDIQCTCKLDTNALYRIVAACEDQRADLGICVPTGDSFGLRKKIPVKQLGEGELKFSVILNSATKQGVFYPICSDTPFAHIELLPYAVLEKRDGKIGAVVCCEE